MIVEMSLPPSSTEISRFKARVDRKVPSLIGRPGKDGPQKGPSNGYSWDLFIGILAEIQHPAPQGCREPQTFPPRIGHVGWMPCARLRASSTRYGSASARRTG